MWWDYEAEEALEDSKVAREVARRLNREEND